MTTYAIIVAAGSGTRAGGELPKQYQMIGENPVITHTLQAFKNHSDIDKTIVVISSEHRELYDNAVEGISLLPPVTGGKTRQQSVFNGLKAINDDQPDKVLIHDAARPFVSPDIISAIVDALETSQCVIPAIPVVDTISHVQDCRVVARLDREALRAVQTPQGFDFNTIYAAHAKAADDGNELATDDSALVDKIQVVDGDLANKKLTTASDIFEADKNMKQSDTKRFSDLLDIRIGQGFDVHAFEQGDHVTLCGVKIPFTSKLQGHSDADVSMHALTDAILGAIGEGDIGKHYPPSDGKWKDASSDIFLKGALELVNQRGGILAHSDVTIICEAPKLRPHIDAMCNKLAEIINCDASRVSVKATTSEQLGFTGRGEGIAAMATATVRLPF